MCVIWFGKDVMNVNKKYSQVEICFGWIWKYKQKHKPKHKPIKLNSGSLVDGFAAVQSVEEKKEWWEVKLVDENVKKL